MFQCFQMLFIDTVLTYLLQCECRQLSCLVRESKVLGNSMLKRYCSIVAEPNLPRRTVCHEYDVHGHLSR